MKKRQTTIIDIARALGISKSTVSRALLNHPDIKEETKQLILEYVKKSRYRPNLQALGLLRNQSNTIGVIIPNIERPFFASAISGIQHRASQSNFRVMICQSDETQLAEMDNLEALADMRVDGLLVCHSKETENFQHILELHGRGIPLVLFDRVNPLPQISKVELDDFLGGFLIGQHLAENGYRNVAILAGPRNLAISEKRKEGCITALKQAGIATKAITVIHCDFQQEREIAAILSLTKRKVLPDAIFSVYEMGAIVVMDLLQKKGFRVPEEIAVAGFGNEPIGQYTRPSLTTIFQNPFQMGEVAADLLLKEILSLGPVEPFTHVVKPELVIRNSTSRIKEWDASGELRS